MPADWHSRYPDIVVPEVHVSEHVLAACGANADVAAFVDGATGESLTYGQIDELSRRVAAGLIERGIGPGDVVAILSANSIRYPVAFHGALLAGAVVSPINPAYTGAEVEHQLRSSGARLVVTSPDLKAKALAAGAQHVVTALEDLLGVTPLADAVPLDPATAVAVLPYSSGTTGLPKGVMLTHRNLVANITQFGETVYAAAGSDRIIAVLPFFHIYGLTLLMNFPMTAGLTVVTMPRFELGEFLRIVEQYRISRAYVAPPIMLALAKDPRVDDFDLSSLRVLLSGAAPLGPDLARAVHHRLGDGVAVLQGYGMTELSPASHISPDPGREPASGGPAPYGTIGYALPNTECRLVDPESGRDAPGGGPGELWIRGPQVMAGYLHNPEATAATVDSDGWLHTGDVATVDAAGCYQIVDRLKELIKCKGYQVPPAEIEAVLLRHPAVLDVAVVGAPDQDAGEVPVAFVVVKSVGRQEVLGPNGSAEATVEELMTYVADHVAHYKRLKAVIFVAAIPKSASGKILRRELRPLLPAVVA